MEKWPLQDSVTALHLDWVALSRLRQAQARLMGMQLS